MSSPNLFVFGFLHLETPQKKIRFSLCILLDVFFGVEVVTFNHRGSPGWTFQDPPTAPTYPAHHEQPCFKRLRSTEVDAVLYTNDLSV